MRPQRRRQQRRRSGGGATMRRFEQRRRSGGGATMRRFETTGALTEWSGSVEKCECRGGNVAPPGCLAEANLPHWLLIGGGRHGRLSHVPRVAELTEADPQLRYSTRRNHATHVASNFRPCMSVPMSRGTEYGAKIASFHKELNTIPSKYMLRRAQTNQQKLLNLENQVPNSRSLEPAAP